MALRFSVLGQQPERLLPELIVGWFIALLVLGSQGRTRIFGTIVVAITDRGRGRHVSAALCFGVDVPDIKLRWLLLFVWLLLRERQVGRADSNDR